MSFCAVVPGLMCRLWHDETIHCKRHRVPSWLTCRTPKHVPIKACRKEASKAAASGDWDSVRGQSAWIAEDVDDKLAVVAKLEL